jgi:hypothetical protein
MTEEQAPFPLREDTDVKLPAAAYLRYEQRADGWSAGRQAAFLSHLADNGVVADAAKIVGKHLSGGYALRRTARGYAFNLGWEAALIIARRVVADELMTAAIRGEQSRWVREDGVTTYTRQNTKLSLILLDRVNPATTLPEVMAVATRFDWFLQLIDEGANAEALWDYFFDDALPHTEHQARARVKASLLLSEESLGFEGDGGEDDDDIEYKSMEGPPVKQGMISSHEDTKARRGADRRSRISSLTCHHSAIEVESNALCANRLSGLVASCEPKIPKVDATHQAAYLHSQARPGREAHFTNNAPPNSSLNIR